MRKKLIKITLCSALLAMAFVLELVTGFIPGLNLSMPLGGRFFGISLFPLLLIGFILGPFYGFLSGLTYGVLTFFTDGWAMAYFATDINAAVLILILDYVIAFTTFGVTGFFAKGLKKNSAMITGIFIALFLRFLSSTLSGTILWASYAHYYDFTASILDFVGGSALWYSVIYNALYSITTLATLMVVVVLSRKQIYQVVTQYPILGVSENLI